MSWPATLSDLPDGHSSAQCAREGTFLLTWPASLMMCHSWQLPCQTSVWLVCFADHMSGASFGNFLSPLAVLSTNGEKLRMFSLHNRGFIDVPEQNYTLAYTCHVGFPCLIQAVSSPRSKHWKQKSAFLATLAVSQPFHLNQVTQNLQFCRFDSVPQVSSPSIFFFQRHRRTNVISNQNKTEQNK